MEAEGLEDFERRRVERKLRKEAEEVVDMVRRENAVTERLKRNGNGGKSRESAALAALLLPPAPLHHDPPAVRYTALAVRIATDGRCWSSW